MLNNEPHNNSSSFKDYFSGVLDDTQKEGFENKVNSDEFEKEAFEGFESLGNESEASRIIDEVNRKIRVKAGLENPLKDFPFPSIKVLGIAASIILLLGFGFFINQQLKTDKKPIAQNEHIEKDNQNSAAGNKLEDTSSFKEENRDKVQNISLPETQQVESEVIDKIDDAVAPKIVEESPIEDIEEETIALTAEKEPAKENKPLISAKEEVEQDSEALSMQTDMASLRTEKTDNYAIASSLFKEKQYKAAKNYYAKAIENKQNIEDSKYHLAMCSYHLHNNDNALETFDDIIKRKGLYANNAKWFKALVLLEKGDTENAKSLLKDLSEGNSGFNNQASDLLNKID